MAIGRELHPRYSDKRLQEVEGDFGLDNTLRVLVVSTSSCCGPPGIENCNLDDPKTLYTSN